MLLEKLCYMKTNRNFMDLIILFVKQLHVYVYLINLPFIIILLIVISVVKLSVIIINMIVSSDV